MIIVRFLKLHGRTSSLLGALSGCIVDVLGLMFVDDSDLVQFGRPGQSSLAVAEELDRTVQLWQKGLEVSGGTLRPEKCYWYLLSYVWTDGKWDFDESSDRVITVKDCNGTRGMVTKLKASEAKEVVGVWIAPDGSNTVQLQHTREKIKEMVDRISSSTLNSAWMWKGFIQGKWRSIAYPFGATSFSPEECEALTRQMYKAVLPAVRVNRNIPKIMRYAPVVYGGLGLPSPYLEQGIQQIQLILEHGAECTLTGNLIRQSFEQMHLEVGELQSVWTLPFKRFGFLATDSWTKGVWQFCSSSKVKLQWRDCVLPSPLREGDKGILQMCRENGISSETTLRIINRVRCHLQVITLADISVGDGRRIREDMLDGRRGQWQSHYEFGEEYPSVDDRVVWRNTMRRISNNNFFWDRPLGRWIAAPHIQHRWMWCPIDDTLWEYVGSRTDVWRKYHRPRGGESGYRRGRWATSLPASCQVATVHNVGEGMVELCSAMEVLSSNTARDVAAQQESLRIDQWIDTYMQWFEPRNRVRELLLQGNCRVVADGSYMKELDENLGAAYWILETHRGVCIGKGGCLTSGGIGNAFRAELVGIYGALLALVWALQGQRLTRDVWIGCDCKSALDCLLWKDRKTSCSLKHHDVRREIRHLRTRCGLVVRGRHIDGHRDRVCAWNELSRWEQLNVMCDAGAKTILRDAITRGSTGIPSLPTEQWICWSGQQKICHNPHSTILKQAVKEEVQKQMIGKHIVGPRGFSAVDWKIVEAARCSLSAGRKIWLMKQSTGFCGSGIMMHRCGLWENSICKCCLREVEHSPWHIFECQNAEMKERRRELLDNLETWMLGAGFEEGLVDALMRYIKDGGWPMAWDGTLLPLQLSVLSNLQKIGMKGLFLGMLPLGMLEWQKEYWLLNGGKGSARLLLTKLSGRLLDITHSLWTLRCTIVHDQSNGNIYVEEVREIRELIDRQFRTIQPTVVQNMLTKGKDHVLNLPISCQIGWLSEVFLLRGEMDQVDRVRTLLRPVTNRIRKRKLQDDVDRGAKRRRLARERQAKGLRRRRRRHKDRRQH